MRNSIIIISVFLFISTSWAKAPYALFSPIQGNIAFSKMFQLISNAKNYAHVTAYSWSDSNLDKALIKAVQNGAKARVILHRPLAKKTSMLKRYQLLEKAGVEIKIAPINMHEKIVLVDDLHLVNSSANMSTGARIKYAENFVFFTANNQENKNLIKDFINEFTLMWNSSYDMITHGEKLAAPLTTLTKNTNIPRRASISLFSSSMNFKYSKTSPNTKKAQRGMYYTMTRIKNQYGQTWTVRDMIIQQIRSARNNIYVNLNHFNIRLISQELIKAAARGIKVYLMMDNQEYRTRPNNKEMTPEFVIAYKKLFPKKEVPVRIYYYSHNPSPKYWFLNHNKTLIIDYGTQNTKLITGSYNLSRTAEHNQFDNMILFQGQHLGALYTTYHKEFMRLWRFNRTASDTPSQKILNSFLTPNSNNQYIIHSKTPISLKWSEVDSLRGNVNKVAPGIFRGGFQRRNCYYYNPATSKFSGCY